MIYFYDLLRSTLVTFKNQTRPGLPYMQYFIYNQKIRVLINTSSYKNIQKLIKSRQYIVKRSIAH